MSAEAAKKEPEVTMELVPAGEQREQHALMRPVVSPAHLVDLHKEITELIRTALEEGTDYGKIPGCDKASLLKAGAERICTAFGVYPRYSIVDKEIDHDREVSWCKRKKQWRNGKHSGWEEQHGTSLGLYRYVVRAELVKRDNGGSVVGDGLGSCSTLEGKYIDRPRDMENTVLKMAEKRALVAATLNAFGLSDRFSQDVEDQESAEVTEERQAPRPASNGKASADQWRKLEELEKDERVDPRGRAFITEVLGKRNLSKEGAQKIIGKAMAAIRQREAEVENAGPPPAEDPNDVLPEGM